MTFRLANIAGAVSQADTDTRQSRLADLQLRTGEQNLQQGSRLNKLQLETSQADLDQKRRAEALKQLEMSGNLAERVITSGGSGYDQFKVTLQQLGVPPESIPQQYDQTALQNMVDQSRSLIAKEFEDVQGMRGSLLQRNKKTGELKQIVGPDNSNITGANRGSLPTPALKLQQEELELLGVSANTVADLTELKRQIDNKEVNFGPVDNLMNRARNYAGISNDQSRNFATAKATLEKLRNDSLLAHNGVQTEGDAQRAWNQIFENMNDEKLVSERLSELIKLDERAKTLRRNKIDSLRQNYGLDPLDTSGFETPQAAIGGKSSNQTYNNRRIPAEQPQTGGLIQEQDGSYTYRPRR